MFRWFIAVSYISAVALNLEIISVYIENHWIYIKWIEFYLFTYKCTWRCQCANLKVAYIGLVVNGCLRKFHTFSIQCIYFMLPYITRHKVSNTNRSKPIRNFRLWMKSIPSLKIGHIFKSFKNIAPTLTCNWHYSIIITMSYIYIHMLHFMR